MLLFYKNIFQKLPMANTSVLFTPEIIITEVSMQSKKRNTAAEFCEKCNNSYALLTLYSCIKMNTQ